MRTREQVKEARLALEELAMSDFSHFLKGFIWALDWVLDETTLTPEQQIELWKALEEA